MRLDRHRTGSSYPSRRDRSRLVRMVGLMALVLIAIQFARKPASWEWFARLAEPQGAAAEPAAPPFKPIQIHRPADRSELGADDVYARVDDASPPDAAVDPVLAAAAPRAAEQPQHAWSLPPGTLDGVVDDWFGLTRGEQPALGRLAAYLAGPAATTLASDADPQVTFEGLLGNPDYYRGRPVMVRGRLRRCMRGRIGQGAAAREVWEAWVIAPDSRNTPYLVYALSAPERMPTGDALDEDVTIRGVFVRRFAYASTSGEAITAMLLAPSLAWTPATPPAPQRLKQELQWTTLAFVGLIGVVLLGAGGWYLWSDRRFRRSRLHAIGESRLDAAAADLQALEHLDGGNPHRIRVAEPAATPPG